MVDAARVDVGESGIALLSELCLLSAPFVDCGPFLCVGEVIIACVRVFAVFLCLDVVGSFWFLVFPDGTGRVVPVGFSRFMADPLAGSFGSRKDLMGSSRNGSE